MGWNQRGGRPRTGGSKKPVSARKPSLPVRRGRKDVPPAGRVNGSLRARHRAGARKLRKPPGLALVRKPNGTYWLMGTYLRVRVRESTFETDLARAKQALSDKLKAIRDEHDGRTCAVAQPLPIVLSEVQPSQAEAATPAKTFFEACVGYCEAHSSANPAWLKQINRIKVFVGPDVSCRSAGVHAFVTMVATGLGKPGHSSATVKRQFLSPIKAVLTWAAAEWGADQGCFTPKFRKLADGQRNETVLTPLRADDFVAEARKRGWYCLEAVIEVGLCEGPRRGELYGLYWADVDLVGRRLVFRDVKDKSGVRRNRTIKDPHRRTIDTLRRYGSLTGRPSDQVFVRDDGTPFVSIEAFGLEMNAGLREIAEALSLRDTITLHVLRHSFASYEYAVRPDPEWVRQRGDWKSLSSAMRYVHLLGVDLAAAVRAFWRDSSTG